MRHRLLSQFILVLAVGAVVAPLAHAADPYDGYKSSYPKLHQLLSVTQAGHDGYKSSYPELHQLHSVAQAGYDGYKSSYPELHQLHSVAQAGYDGYKSSYPELHLVLSHQVTAPLVQAGGRGFVWRDAAVGAGTAAVTILLIAGAGLFLTRRLRVVV